MANEDKKDQLIQSLISEDKVWVSVERSVNLGDYYAYVKFQAGESRTIPQGQDPRGTRDEVAGELIADIDAYIRSYKENM